MVRRGQLLALGVTDNVMQYRIRRGGPWQVLLPGVHRVAGVAAEVDSREWHLSPEHWDRTRRRHTLMAAAGIHPLHF